MCYLTDFASRPTPQQSAQYKPTMNGDILHHDSYDSLASATSNSAPPTNSTRGSQHPHNEKPTSLALSRAPLPSGSSLDNTDADWVSCDSLVTEQKAAAKPSPTRHRPKHHSLKTRHHKPGVHIKHGASLDRHPPRSKSAKQRANGLIGLHALAAKDMTDIMGDVESPRNGSLHSTTDNESRPDSALQHDADDGVAEKLPPPKIITNSEPMAPPNHDHLQARDNHNHDHSPTPHHTMHNHRVDNDDDSPDEMDHKYVITQLSKENSQKSLSHSESDNTSTSSETISEEGSYTIQRDDTLSPLMEASICSSHKGGSSTPPLLRGSVTPPNYRQDSSPIRRDSCSPPNHKDSTHPAIRENATPDYSSLPKPMTDIDLEPGVHSVDMNEVPDPPPEFMSDYEPSIQPYMGLWKGVPSTKGHSSYMEAILYLLSVSTDLLCCDRLESSYTELKNFLLQKIVYPLKR